MFPISTVGAMAITFTAVAALLLMLLSGCTMLLLEDDLAGLTIAHTSDLLLITDEGLYDSITPDIDRYVQELQSQNCSVNLTLWQGGTAVDLKSLIRAHYEADAIGGVFLVGTLPCAWYEHEGFFGYEAFPTDVYFMDLNADWQDTDHDGVFDYHSALDLDVFISRIDGTSDQIHWYFEKIHAYRTGELVGDENAFIFKDNDWIDFEKGSTFGLENLFSNVSITDTIEKTIKQEYLQELSPAGPQYVYQWIHSYPSLLCIKEGDLYNYLYASEISNNNLGGLFFNLFNCSASRFTEENIAMTYLTGTDYGLATTGTTKPGGNYYPKAFHHLLSQGNTWGEAFRGWYNHYGVTDDRWFLGMVILGDPMLAIQPTVHKIMKTAPLTQIEPDQETIEALEQLLIEFQGSKLEL
jgi:hypothetical protein